MSAPDARPDRPRLGAKVTLLCITSGSLDAVTVLAVGDAFASVMTGNIVLLGVSAGSADGGRLLACVLAILGYVLGGLIGSWLTHRSNGGDAEPVWPSRVTRTLAVEVVLLIGLAVAWLLEPEPSYGVKLALLAVAASAMGVQSSAVRAVKVPVSTTYLTGALTGVVEAIATRTRFSTSNRNGLYGLIALLTGALAGGLTVLYFRPAALVLPAVAVASVVVISWVEHRRHR